MFYAIAINLTIIGGLILGSAIDNTSTIIAVVILLVGAAMFISGILLLWIVVEHPVFVSDNRDS
jgi:hypothetical protein